MILYGFPYAFPLKRPKLARGVQEMNDFIWFSHTFPLKCSKLAGGVREMSDLYGFPYTFPLKRPKLARGVQEMSGSIWFSVHLPPETLQTRRRCAGNEWFYMVFRAPSP